MSRVRVVSLSLFASLAVAAFAAQPAMGAIVGTNDPNTLAGAMSNSNETGASLDVSPTSGDAASESPFADGVSDVPLAGFPTALGTYTILTTGDSALADDPNGSDSSGFNQNYNPASRGDANDPTTLGIAFNTPANTNCLNFDYKFFSEEFPEFVGSTFNDRFIAELDKSTWTASGETSTAPLDFAARGTQVSINAIGPNAVSAANAAGTTYDAASATLTTKTPVTPGAHTLYLSIFDASDHAYDSAVFLDNLTFTNVPAIKCQPPDIFKGAVGVDLPSSATFKNGNAFIPVDCKLPDEATVNCAGTLTVTAGGGGNGRALTRASISKAKKVGKKKYSVAPGKTKKIKVKIKGSAKRTLSKKGKQKVKTKVKVANKNNGAKKTFKLKLKG